MPERATYQVLLDIAYRLDAPDSNIAQYVTDISFSYGLNDPMIEFAPPARAYITLVNSSGVFNPDDPTAEYYSDLYRGQIVQITMNGTKIFAGKIVNRDYSIEDFVTVTVEDQMLRLLSSTIKPPLLENVRVDEAIGSVFEQQVALYPYDFEYFTLNRSKLEDVYYVGGKPRNVANRLFGTTVGATYGAYANLTMDEARTTLTYAGDITMSETSAQTYLRELVAAEGGGRFFWDPTTEKFTFQNRFTDSVNYTVDATLVASEILSGLFSMDDGLVNKCEVTYTPRSVSEAVTVLYASPNTAEVKTSSTITVNASFKDPANETSTCGGKDVVCIPGTDIILNSKQDGSGENVTSQHVVVIEVFATSATITITNTATTSIWVTKLQVRGRPISLLASETAEEKNITSIQDYDLQESAISIPALDNADTAQSIARIMVAKFAEPYRRFRRVTFMANYSAKLLGYARDLRIGNGIRLTYDDHDQTYVIIGQEHRISPGGSNRHEVSLWVKDTRITPFFVIGESRVSGPNLLAF